MKRVVSIISALTLCLTLGAQSNLRERVYISTDKNVYVAGDDIWCSAYCMDVNSGALSNFSELAYVELHSTEGMVQTGKIALDKGRGAGRIEIPNTVPTGNYSLFAYTAQLGNEQGSDFLQFSKTISIFNTFSSARVDGGVMIADHVSPEVRKEAAAVGGLSINAGTPADGVLPLTLRNQGNEAVSVSLSVFHDDGIPAPANRGIADFVSSVSAMPRASFSSGELAEYEGEVIKARVVGPDAEAISLTDGLAAFISAPNVKPASFSSTIRDGKVTFYTDNIYGNKDLFMQIEGLPEGSRCFLELESPFVDVPVKDIPALTISPDMAESLKLRSASMQLSKVFDSDTLYCRLPDGENLLFDDTDMKRYILDDYTRFPVMEELFIEFMPELRTRRTNGTKDIQVRMVDSYYNMYFPSGVSLMMIDGVPVLDQSIVLDYDPLLVKYVDIYPNTYFLGSRVFCGVVNFITYKGNLPAVKLPDSVRVVNFQGTAYPQAFTCESLERGEYPDYRQTIYWNPIISIEPGQSIEIKCKTPAYGGRFEIVAEGLDSACRPVGATASADVKAF